MIRFKYFKAKYNVRDEEWTMLFKARNEDAAREYLKGQLFHPVLVGRISYREFHRGY